jgi:hypothetical protein
MDPGFDDSPDRAAGLHNLLVFDAPALPRKAQDGPIRIKLPVLSASRDPTIADSIMDLLVHNAYWH